MNLSRRAQHTRVPRLAHHASAPRHARLARAARFAVLILCALVLFAAPARTGERRVEDGSAQVVPMAKAPRWGLPQVLPMSDEARDPIFALFIGLVEEDLYGVVTQERLRTAVARSGRRSQLPVERLGSIRRGLPDEQGGPTVTLNGIGPVDVPVPYEILGYHPGRFRASPRSRFQEWDLGTVVLDVGRWRKGGGSDHRRYEDVRIWGLVEGRVEMDVDGWLDAVMGSSLDDTIIVGLALFRFEGELFGVATGYSKKGQGRSGAFSFGEDKMVFPNRTEFKALGSYVRGRLERELPDLLRHRRR